MGITVDPKTGFSPELKARVEAEIARGKAFEPMALEEHEDDLDWLTKGAGIDLKHLFENKPPDLDFVWPGFLAGTVGMLSGPGAVGKSLLALQIAIDVSCGSNLAGLRSVAGQAGRVLLLNAEDPEDEICRRLYSAGQLLSESERVLSDENLEIRSLCDLNVNIMNAHWRDWVEDEAQGARLVIIDTLREFHSLDEMQHKEMTILMRYFRSFCVRCKTTVLILHRNRFNQAWPLESYPRLHMSLSTPSLTKAAERGIKAGEHTGYVILSSEGRDLDSDSEKWYRRGEGGLLRQMDFEKSKARSSKWRGRA